MTEIEDQPSRMVHHGYGPQIVGPNYAPISYEVMLDPKYKAVVEKFNATAPGVAMAIEKAARDGIMPREAIAALDRVADHINWDIATILNRVGDHINWDTAEILLTASKGINPDVARDFRDIQRELGTTKRELDSYLTNLRQTVGELQGIQAGTGPSHNAPAEFADYDDASSSRNRDSWWFRFKLSSFGTGLGLPGAVLLMTHHLEGWAVFTGALLVFPVVFWVARKLWTWFFL